MKKLLLASATCVFIIAQLSAQITFQRTYGTTGLDFTYASLGDQTADGGFALCSYTSYTGADSAIYFVRLDSIGGVVWSKKYNDGWTDPFAMKATSDGGFIIAGATNDSLSSIGGYLLKIDGIGNIQWSRAYGGAWLEQLFDVEEASDGGFIAVGESQSFNAIHNTELYLIKTSASGNLEWGRTFSAGSGGSGTTVTETVDGKFVAVGTTNALGGAALIVKTDALGGYLWSNTITASTLCYDITECSDGSLVMVTTAIEGMEFMKMDSSGNLLWAKAYGPSVGYVSGNCLSKTSDGGFALSGYNQNTIKPTLVKLDSAGALQWVKEYGGGAGYACTTQPFTMQQTMDSGFIIAITDTAHSGDLALIKTDATGFSGCNEISATFITTNIIRYDSVMGTMSFAPGQFFGHTVMTPINTLSTTYCGVPISIEEMPAGEPFVFYPNPSDGKFRIYDEIVEGELWIYNSVGDLILHSAPVKEQIDLSSQPNGIYFVSVISEGEMFTQKIIIKK